MKRIILITSTAATFLAVALPPAVATAGGHHHRHHHKGAHARLQSFGTSSPTAPANDSAGTVTSFTGGVLTIKLTDGSSVTGKVTTATELKCEAAPVSSMARIADHGGSEDGGPSGDNSSSGNDAHGGENNSSGNDGHDGPGSNDSQSQSSSTPVVDSSDDNGQHADEPQPPAGEQTAEGEDKQGEACEMSSLTEGTTVRNAELSVTSTGATFLEVEIIL
jgi:hypothetical protein